jgi:hypothetical protein
MANQRSKATLSECRPRTKNTKYMQANELRIGNLIYKRLKSGNGRTITGEVGCQDIVRIFEGIGSFIYEPILLTENWLEKLGFVKIAGNYEINNGTTNLVCHKNEINEVVEGQWKTYSHIKFIHQLQNLWFCLTGEELVIKK